MENRSLDGLNLNRSCGYMMASFHAFPWIGMMSAQSAVCPIEHIFVMVLSV